MSSSISSSDVVFAAAAESAPSRTRRVLLVLLIGLCALEVVTRVKLFHLSKDFVQYQTYPARAAALARRDGTRIAIVGNSITHEDIDRVALAARLESLTGTKVATDVFSVDHSYVNNWYYVMQRYFWRPGNHVDLVVVPFWGTNLYDDNELEIGRLAQFFTTPEDWPTVLTEDLTTMPDRADFLASSFWATFAARDRMRELVFTTGLPDYKGYARREQDVLVNRLAIAAANKPKRVRTSRELRRFLRAARENDTRVVLMAFPTLHTEWSDTYVDVARLVGQARMRYVDLRATPGLSDASYADLVHMNDAGRALFTARLAETVAPLVHCDEPGCHAFAARTDAASSELARD